MELVLIVILTFFLIRLSNRINTCELALKKLKKQQLGEPLPKPPASPRECANEKEEIPPQWPQYTPQTTLSFAESSEINSKVQPQTAPFIRKPRPPSPLFLTLRDNWMGIFGSLALIMGAVFFGLTSKIMQLPQARVALLFAGSFLFFWFSRVIKKNQQLVLPSGWLRSIGGAIILFATVGAGGIPGLQFIHNPIYALAFLCLGIGINLTLAFTTTLQTVASLHVILSLLAFCIVPQELLILPLGALVAVIGLLASWRSKWDMHLLFIIIAYACFNTVWSLSASYVSYGHDLAIGCSTVVALLAAAIHYSKKYAQPQFEPLPLCAHLSNWILFIWNISYHVHWTKVTPFILSIIALAGFIMAYQAKKRGIQWLYRTDTILAQLLALSAIASLYIYTFKMSDLGILLLIESIAFCAACRFQKEQFLLRVGYGLQSVICFLSLTIFFMEIGSTQNNMINLRIAFMAVLCWSFFEYLVSKKKWPIDDPSFIFSGDKVILKPVSLTALFGMACFMTMVLVSWRSPLTQVVTLIGMGFMAYRRKHQEDQTKNITQMGYLVFLHLISFGGFLLSLLVPSARILTYLWLNMTCLAILDAWLIFNDMLNFKLWQKNITASIVYALGLLLGGLAYLLTKEISLLIPGILFLGLSLIFLETGRFAPKALCLSKSMTETGLALLVGFLIRFVMVHLQIDPIWHGVSIRWITEAFGLISLFYWIKYFPEDIFKNKGSFLIETSLAYLTLCVFIEFPDSFRPVIWAAGAISLLLGVRKVKWPKRLLAYSWIYFVASIVHVACVTGTLTMPSLFFLERYYLPVMLSVICQFTYVFLIYQNHGKIEALGQDYWPSSFITLLCRQRDFTILLPVFLGIACLFLFNFEKTILTILWNGLTCLYLCVGLLIKSKRTIQIAMAAIVLCALRLMIFDLRQADPALRALIFIGVGILMLGISMLYKKFKHRIEAQDAI